MKKLIIILALTGLFLFQGTFSSSTPLVYAKDFPSKNLRWVVPYKPGGGFDTYSRAVARTMKKFLPKGINVIVTNKPGAGGQVATNLLYRSKPDGYTMGILPMPGQFVPQMFHKTKYDMKKMTWLGTILNEPMFFILAKSSNLKSLKEVQQADRVRIASTGLTGPEIVTPITMEAMGIKVKFIKGHGSSKEAALAAMRGDADAILFTYGTNRRYVKSKQFKGLVLIGTDKRSDEFPDVPTAIELGYPQLGGLGAWRVVAAPPKLKKDRYKYLNNILKKSLNDPEFLKWSKKAKRPVTPMDGEATRKKIMGLIEQYDKKYRNLLMKYMK
jgi:tripartite-type tricarboxylate transporter receptor subunit TctC